MNATEIFEELKANMPADYEKETPGFLTYDILKAVSIEDEKLYGVVNAIKSKLDPSNLKGEELARECLYRRGIIRKPATFAKAVLSVTGTGTINTGDLFSTSNYLRFRATETKSIIETGIVTAECVTAGIIGIVGANSINQMPVTLNGITSVTNNAASYDGFEAETDESLLERYLDDVQRPATSNNIYHFEKWAREIAGVGRCKVFPTWNGNNSVKLAIINSNMLPASSDLVSDVQEYIDPIAPEKWGKGYGQAAIGSYCTVISGMPNTCNVSATITKSDNYTLQTIMTAITSAITEYFKDIAFHETINYVSYAKIAALIVNVEGVLDVNEVLLNNETSNIILLNEEIPVIGIVTVTMT